MYTSLPIEPHLRSVCRLLPFILFSFCCFKDGALDDDDDGGGVSTGVEWST